MRFPGLRSRCAIALFLAACAGDAPSDVGLDIAALAAGDHRALAACVRCTYVRGRNDLKKLCPGSVDPWDDLVGCSCAGPCAAACSADWCARLGDVKYTDASPACMDCALAECWPEILACSAAE